MAAESLVKGLPEEASCSICLEYFKDPVTIAQCGHNFCRPCLTQNWKDSVAGASCPQCRGTAQPQDLTLNRELANVVEKARRLSLQEDGGLNQELANVVERARRLSLQEDGGLNRELANVVERARRPSLQEDGGLNRKLANVVERARRFSLQGEDVEERMRVEGKGAVCKEHQEPLKFFCKDDQGLLCVACDQSKDHQDHNVIPTEEAAQEYEGKFHRCLEILMKKKDRKMADKAYMEKKSQDFHEQTEAGRQKMVAEFRKMHQFLEEEEKHLLARMEEVEKEIARERDEHLARLSRELSTIGSLSQEVQEKIQQPPSEFLQDVGGFLKRFGKKRKMEDPVAFSPQVRLRIQEVCDISLSLKGVKKRFKANVTLDPETDHSQVIPPKFWKAMKMRKKARRPLSHPERFACRPVMRRFEGFMGDPHFWGFANPERAHPQFVLPEFQKTVRVRGKAHRLLSHPERFAHRPVMRRFKGFMGDPHFWGIRMESEEWVVGIPRKRWRGLDFSPEENSWWSEQDW